MKREHWKALLQLYFISYFSQITFHDNTDEYVKLATGLKAILDGNFQIEWNGKNQQGIDVPEGTYLITIVSQNFSKTIKVIKKK